MADGYSMKAREDGIVVFRLPNQSRDTVNDWLEDLKRLGQAWIENELALLLVDMRGAGIVTPYSSDSLQKVSHATAATTSIKTAFILDKGTAMTLANRFLQSLGPLLGNKQAFATEEDAVSWLWHEAG
jgi:hypothetical protein